MIQRLIYLLKDYRIENIEALSSIINTHKVDIGLQELLKEKNK